MIGKMTKGASASGLLHYCYYEKENLSKTEKEHLSLSDVRGEVMYIQNLAINTLSDGRFDMDYIAKQMRECADKNRNLKDYVWHQSFSFPKGENLSKEAIEKITQSFSKDFGFQENQLIVFKHHDTQHPHFHIVANRINSLGATTAKDSFSHLRTGEFCRQIEQKFGLTITPTMKALLPVEQRKNRYSESIIADEIRHKIDKHLVKSHSIEELKTGLQKEKIKMYIGRGVSFLDKETGAKFKGSDLGREYSLMNLEKRLQASINQIKINGAENENTLGKDVTSVQNQLRITESMLLQELSHISTATTNNRKKKQDDGWLPSKKKQRGMKR